MDCWRRSPLRRLQRHRQLSLDSDILLGSRSSSPASFHAVSSVSRRSDHTAMPPTQRSVRRCFYIFIAVALAYITIGGALSDFTSGRNKDPIFDLENDDWVATGTWSDRAVCRWFGLCGSFHIFHHADRTRVREKDNTILPIEDLVNYWSSGQPDDWSYEERQLREIPQYVFDHAPYVHLSSEEQFWPTDLAEHLKHTTGRQDYNEILDEHSNGSTSLHALKNVEGRVHESNIYLQSNDDVDQLPDWLTGAENIPNPFAPLLDDSGKPKPALRHHHDLRARALGSSLKPAKQQQRPSGRSTAPALLIVVPKENDVVDAFWFFFYSFNQAPKVLNIQFGNHVGDWEHTLIRFQHGKPQSVFVSEHHFGAAYAWDALEKYLPNDDGAMASTWSNETAAELAKRPVVYSATGSHAMYVTPGPHPYILPWGVLADDTDRGPLWDPALNVQSYTYDLKTVRSSTRNPKAPTDWFDYSGHWGDKYYPLSDPRQYRFAGQYHYLSGPYGPKFKHLDRTHACQGPLKCDLLRWAGDERPKRLHLPHEDLEAE